MLGGGRNGTRKRQRSKHKQKNNCKKVNKTPNKLMISVKEEKIVRQLKERSFKLSHNLKFSLKVSYPRFDERSETDRGYICIFSK